MLDTSFCSVSSSIFDDAHMLFFLWYTLLKGQLILWTFCLEASLALSDTNCKHEFQLVQKDVSEKLHYGLGPKPSDVRGKFLNLYWWAFYCVQNGLICFTLTTLNSFG